jgi:5-methylcytosine-specific restriction endonuclease McrA
MQTKKSDPFYMSPQWRKMRFRILHRDNYTCVQCQLKLTSKELQVDHIVPRTKAPHLALEPSNLRTLCRVCHTRAPTSMGRPQGYKEKPFINLSGAPDGWE